MRILPRFNGAVNEEWISDKTRHIVDGLRTQRLDRPYIRENGALRAASWSEAFAAIAAKVKGTDGKRIGALAGDLAAVEEIFALKDLLSKLGSVNMAVQGGDAFNPARGRASYIFNPTIAGIEHADALLIVGSNPRKEAAILNARIRKRWRTGQLKIGVIGERADLTYEYDYLGAGADSLADLAAGKNKFLDALKGANYPIILVGGAATSRPDGAAILAAAAKAAIDFGGPNDDWNGFAVLHDAASRVGALDLGFVPGKGGLNAGRMTAPGGLDVLFSLGADEIKVPDGVFVVYIGTHGDAGAHRADVILPGAAYTEKTALCQHGRPGSDGEPGELPARRGARGLGDHSCAVRNARQDPAVMTRWPPCGGDVQDSAASDADRPDRGRRYPRDQRSGGQGRQYREVAVQASD